MNAFETKLNGLLYGRRQWQAWDHRVALLLRKKTATCWHVGIAGASAHGTACALCAESAAG